MVLCNAQDGGAKHEATLATAAPLVAIYSAELHGGYSARRDERIARVIVRITRIRSGVGNSQNLVKIFNSEVGREWVITIGRVSHLHSRTLFHPTFIKNNIMGDYGFVSQSRPDVLQYFADYTARYFS